MSDNRFQRSRLPGRPTRTGGDFQGQNYDDIVQNCQADGSLFEDPVFPATAESAFFSKQPPRPFEWKRPKEICTDPQFIVGGASRFDVQQGMLGDSWLLAAIASLTCNRTFLNRVVVPDQCFSGAGYVGCFKFNIWNQGQWQEVVVDDRLPTYNNKLVFMHSAERNEFWTALLEKAYAKLHGSYESLKAGTSSEGMEDFTGGVTETFDLKKADSDLLVVMLKAESKGSLMCCSIEAKPNEVAKKLDNGLVMGHAYSVTSVKNVEIMTQRMQRKIALVRVRNPWGNEREWTGPWSDKSREWSLISDDEREDIGLTFEDDGEFWMSFEDWKNNFTTLEICNLGPDSLSKKGRLNWEAKSYVGQWIRGSTAGGCRNFINSFASNPQFRVVLTDSDDDEDNLCTLVVALLQKDRRKLLKRGVGMLTIGYAIYKVDADGPTGDSRLDTDFFQYNSSVAKSPNFVNTREVVGRHKLSPGTYVIVPSTFDPGEQGTFLFRIYSEKQRESSEMDEETRIVQDRRAPPQTEEDAAATKKMEQMFSRLAGADEEIDAYELQNILNAAMKSELQGEGFSIDICSSMVAMLDGDLTGKLGFQEFQTLWNSLREWRAAFTKHDSDKSGNMSSYELRQAMRSCGFMLSNQALTSINLRYSGKDGKISFQGFIFCIARLKTMIDTFSAIQKNGSAVFNLDGFIQTTMYS